MKFEIDVHTDYEDEVPSYRVHCTRIRPYYDRDNYLCENRNDREVLQADSVEELYEKMAQEVVNWTLKGEEEQHVGFHVPPVDSYTVEFSDIYVFIDWYDEEKMKASKTFQELGAAREAKRIEDARKAEVERKRSEAWRKQENERQERETFERLSKKFGNK